MTQVPEFANADPSSPRSSVYDGTQLPEALIKAYGDRGVPFTQELRVHRNLAAGTGAAHR